MAGRSYDRAASAARDISVRIDDGDKVLENTPDESVTEQLDVQRIPETDVTHDMLLESATDPESWLMYGGGYRQQRHTTADVITPENVGDLEMEYLVQPGTLSGEMEGSPVVVPGDPPIMYQTNGPDHCKAIDARAGDVLWSYTYSNPDNLRLCCGLNNRGVAVFKDRVFMTTLDAGLVALDRYTGEELWYHSTADYERGYSATWAPIVYEGKVLNGSAGGEYGVRGFVDAIDTDSGDRVWRHWTTPQDQWVGDSYEQGACTVWMSVTVDPETDTLYAPTSNPGPDFDATARPGPNPYTTGTLALDTESGEYQWHFQESPHDWWDYDSAAPRILIDREVDGEQRRFAVAPGKTGWVWTMDAEDGKVHERSEEFVQHMNMWSLPHQDLEETPWVMTKLHGGAEWNPPAYSPETGLIYVKGINHPMKLVWEPEEFEPGQPYYGGRYEVAPRSNDLDPDYLSPVGGSLESESDLEVPEQWNRRAGCIAAIDPVSGELVWREWRDYYGFGGALTTATGLMFTGTGDGHFIAYDAETGDHLWEFNVGASVNSSPVSWYDPGSGKQYVAVQAGGGGLGPSKEGDAVAVFAMEGDDA